MRTDLRVININGYEYAFLPVVPRVPCKGESVSVTELSRQTDDGCVNMRITGHVSDVHYDYSRYNSSGICTATVTISHVIESKL